MNTNKLIIELNKLVEGASDRVGTLDGFGYLEALRDVTLLCAKLEKEDMGEVEEYDDGQGRRFDILDEELIEEE